MVVVPQGSNEAKASNVNEPMKQVAKINSDKAGLQVVLNPQKRVTMSPHRTGAITIREKLRDTWNHIGVENDFRPMNGGENQMNAPQQGGSQISARGSVL